MNNSNYNQKGFIPLILIIAVVVLIGFGIFVWNSQKNPVPVTSLPSQTPQSLTSVSTSTIQPKSSATPNVSNSNTLSYNLPSGWSTIKAADGSYELGYDPALFTASLKSIPYDPPTGNPKNIDAVEIRFKNSCCYSFSFYPYPYDGGSRHQFIAEHVASGDIKTIYTSKTFERSYLINAQSSLVLHNVDVSSTTTVGMIPLDQNRALLMLVTNTDPEMTEKILTTLKLLK